MASTISIALDCMIPNAEHGPRYAAERLRVHTDISAEDIKSDCEEGKHNSYASPTRGCVAFSCGGGRRGGGVWHVELSWNSKNSCHLRPEKQR